MTILMLVRLKVFQRNDAVKSNILKIIMAYAKREDVNTVIKIKNGYKTYLDNLLLKPLPSF